MNECHDAHRVLDRATASTVRTGTRSTIFVAPRRARVGVCRVIARRDSTDTFQNIVPPGAPRGTYGPGVVHLRPHAGVCPASVKVNAMGVIRRFESSSTRRRDREGDRETATRAIDAGYFCASFVRRDMSTFETFQGGAHVDLFDAKTHRRATMARGSGSTRSSSSSMASRAVWCGGGGTTYDARARGYVARVRGRALTRGEDGRAIGATQPIVCAQVRAGAGASFSVEVCVRDAGETRRRLVFSSSFTDVRGTPLHCQVPLRNLPREEWVNLLLPLVELVPVCFASERAAYKSIDSIVVRGECLVRKIFTLRGDTQTQTWCGSDGDGGPKQAIVIPRECDFPPGVRATAHTVIPSQDPAVYDALSEASRVRERNAAVRAPIKVAFGRRAPSSPDALRETYDSAPAREDDVDESAASWSNIDQIMSNLRVRETHARAPRHSIASSYSSPSSYCSSREDDVDVARMDPPRDAYDEDEDENRDARDVPDDVHDDAFSEDDDDDDIFADDDIDDVHVHDSPRAPPLDA